MTEKELFDITSSHAYKWLLSKLPWAHHYWWYANCILVVCCFSCSPPAVVYYQFWQPTFPCWLRAILGKGGLFVTLGDWLTVPTGSSTRPGTVCTGLQLIDSSVADCQALTWLILIVCTLFNSDDLFHKRHYHQQRTVLRTTKCPD